jgi:hypothetical protein
MQYRSVLLFSLMLAANICGPDSTAIGFGPIESRWGIIEPKAPQGSIRLKAEEVTIRLRKDSYTVDAVFHLLNTGESSEQLVGIPKGEGDASKFVRSDAWVNGRQICLTEEPSWFWFWRELKLTRDAFSEDHSVTKWLVQKVTFPGHARSTIRVSYEAGFAITFAGMRRSRHLTWHFGDGSYWNGNIGLITFNIDATEIGGLKNLWLPYLNPAWKRLMTRNVAKYELKDCKPGPEAEFTVHLLDQ